VVKNLPANARDASLIPGLGRSPEKGNGSPFQYSCLGHPMDRGPGGTVVHGVTNEWSTTQQLNNNALFYGGCSECQQRGSKQQRAD